MHHRCKYSAQIMYKIWNKKKQTYCTNLVTAFTGSTFKKEKGQKPTSFNKDVNECMNAWRNVFIMSSNIWKQFSFSVMSDYYRTKYHNILDVQYNFFLTQDVVSFTERGADQMRGLGQIRPAPLCCGSAFIFWYLPCSKVRRSPCGGGPSIWAS